MAIIIYFCASAAAFCACVFNPEIVHYDSIMIASGLFAIASGLFNISNLCRTKDK